MDSKRNLRKDILKKLNKYVEGLLDNNDKGNKYSAKNTVPSSNTSEEQLASDLLTNQSETIRQHHITSKLHQNTSFKSSKKLIGSKKKIVQLKTDLSLNDLKVESTQDDVNSKSNDSFCSSKQGIDSTSKVKRSQPEVIVFEDPAKKKRKTDSNTIMTKVSADKPGMDTQDIGSSEINLRQARHDVLRLGISGFEKTKKEDAMTALVVKLGGKAPKRGYVNYKVLQEQRKMQKTEDARKTEIDRALGLNVKNKNRRKDGRKKVKDDITGFLDGQVGHYKHGVQFVKKDELKTGERRQGKPSRKKKKK